MTVNETTQITVYTFGGGCQQPKMLDKSLMLLVEYKRLVEKVQNFSNDCQKLLDKALVRQFDNSTSSMVLLILNTL